MFRKKERFADMGKLKKSTNTLVDNAVAAQNRWLAGLHRRGKRLVGFLRTTDAKPTKKSKGKDMKSNKTCKVLRAYWFPILCALAVIIMALWVVLIPRCIGTSTPAADPIPEPTTRIVAEANVPTFDAVRIGKDGRIVIAGRFAPRKGVSIIVNKKIVATEQTNARGEFTYAPKKEFAPGNYTIRLISACGVRSENDVFVYIPESKDYSKALSLLMTDGGSKLLQAPVVRDGDLVVSKIDYLENGRIVVMGTASPRLRVTLSLDGEQIGMTRVSDHRNFGLGADVERLRPGAKYEITIRMHDTSGTTAAIINHEFVMPEMTPGDETFYTVRRDDSLWVISRNFLGRGALYTLIFDANKDKIKDANLIHPKQELKIPIRK
ncbi:MAG: LysM peptidoglycan-binding domain-containing protein [Alphaproteobacteria bacterium]|nr:LysM peptidoglycan-binding domain-containing protein [Alphaproteobacteria bacterium]